MMAKYDNNSASYDDHDSGDEGGNFNAEYF